MAKILCTGIVTLDIINTVSHYPLEDEELRATAQERRQGGNATNTANVLAQHGHEISLLSVIANDTEGQWVHDQLKNAGVDTASCPAISGVTPTSYITANPKTGSRTIVHYRNLTELSSSQFEKVNIKDFDAFHFEGRNINELRKMLSRCKKQASGKRLFLEVEKPRDEIESLFEFADVLMISKDYASKQGYESGEACLTALSETYPRKLLSCTWGNQGVYIREPKKKVQHIPAEQLGEIRDTVAAGDTFNAGLIHSLCSGKSFGDSARYANSLAAKKTLQYGLENLVKS